MKRALLSFGIIGILFFCFTISAQASEKILDYRVEMELESFGRATITETIKYDFGSEERHGIFRNIPVQYVTSDGLLEVPYTILSVEDGAGRDYKYEESEVGFDVVLKIGDAEIMISGEHTYVIRYRLENIMLLGQQSDELYWNPIGDEWDVPIGAVRVDVQFPEAAHVLASPQCFLGYLGQTDQDQCQISVAPGHIQLANRKTVDPGQGMTLVTQFEKGFFQAPGKINLSMSPWWTKATILEDEHGYEDGEMVFVAPDIPQTLMFTRWGYQTETREVQLFAGEEIDLTIHLRPETWFQYLRYVPFLLAMVIPFLAKAYWKRFGRDIGGRQAVAPEYDTPDSLDPMEMGVIYRENWDNKFISAALIRLAVSGYLKIHHGNGKKDYTFELLRTSLKELDEAEIELMEKLFGPNLKIGAQKELAQLKNSFYKSIGPIKAHVWEEVNERGVFTRNPKKSQGIHFGLAFVGLVLALVLGSFWLVVFISSAGFVFGLVGFVCLLVIAFTIPQRSQKGATLYRRIRGLKMYLEVAEEERIKFHNAPAKQPALFEKLLPYAIVLGVEKQWAEQFKDIYTEPGDWYTGSTVNQLTAMALVTQLTSATGAIAGTLASRPNSSGSGFSSGGSFGGGFSGGGFGGGGGGSW